MMAKINLGKRQVQRNNLNFPRNWVMLKGGQQLRGRLMITVTESFFQE